MNRKFSLGLLAIVMAVILACTTTPVKTTKEWTPPDIPFPLSSPGPYFAGRTSLSIVDTSRDGRIIQLDIYYPALEETADNGKIITYEAKPDRSGAPYPVILTEHRTGRIFGDHLVTHGFVMVIITVPDHAAYEEWDFQMIDWPRDFLFSLDQLASQPPEDLKKVLDTEQVGVTGYSFGGDISLTLSGARIDPQSYLDRCAQPAFYNRMVCSLADKWEAFTAFAGEDLTSTSDGLWQPLTDARIRATMPMAPSGTWLYGERGLAAVDRPVFMIANTEDEFIPYQEETIFLFDHLGGPSKTMITFVGQSHLMIMEQPQSERVKHFATAYFGFTLQGREEYQSYFSADFIAPFPDLFWGVYSSD